MMQPRQSDTSHGSDAHRVTRIALLGILLTTFILYFLTSYRTIAWWDSAEYSLAACTLGIAHPPGSLITTLIGWIWVKLFGLGNPAFALNLLAGLLASATALLLSRLTFSLVPECDTKGRLFWILGAVLGGLSLAFSETIWIYAVRFTPYIMTPLFTVLILTVLLRWWKLADQPEAWRWILLLSLLFGLDFSVHRTNSLLIPGVIFWILIRQPNTFSRLKNWLAATGGMLLGLAFHLVIIPMALAKPFLNAGNPDNLSRFWDYVAVKQAGGGFLVQFLPRKGDIVSVQIADYVTALKNNFFSLGSDQPLVILPLILIIIGVISLLKSHRRLALALIALFVVTSVLTIAYFNIPANFFRSLHRHYLPCLVTLSLFLMYGAASLSLWTQSMTGHKRTLAVGMVAVLLVYMPVSQIVRNYQQVDGSRRTFARDVSAATLNGLAENAILLTGGDNDTFPLWYLQAAEGVRPDVTVLNLSLLNTSWYLSQVIESEPGLPLQELLEPGESMEFVKWSDSTVLLSVTAHATSLSLPPDSVVDTIAFEVTPNIGEQYLMIQDQVVLHLVQENQFRRPLYVGYATYSGAVAWLRPYLQLEGMASRVVPQASPAPALELLSRNLLEVYDLSAYADSTARIDPVSHQMGTSLSSLFLILARSQLDRGDTAACREAIAAFGELLPDERLEPPDQMVEYRKALLEVCGEG